MASSNWPCRPRTISSHPTSQNYWKTFSRLRSDWRSRHSGPSSGAGASISAGGRSAFSWCGRSLPFATPAGTSFACEAVLLMVRRMVLRLTTPPLDMPNARTAPSFIGRPWISPQIAAARAWYRVLGLFDLARSMFEAMRATALMTEAFSTSSGPRGQPDPGLKSGWSGTVEQLRLEAMAGRSVATGVVPYPPGDFTAHAGRGWGCGGQPGPEVSAGARGLRSAIPRLCPGYPRCRGGGRGPIGSTA